MAEEKTTKSAEKLCNFEGCPKTAFHKGLCRKHYDDSRGINRAKNKQPKVCIAEGCENTRIIGRGLCGTHYYRARKAEGTAGKLIGRARKSSPSPVIARSASDAAISPSDFFFLVPEGQDAYTTAELANMDLAGYQVILGRPIKISVEIKIEPV